MKLNDSINLLRNILAYDALLSLSVSIMGRKKQFSY